MTVAISKKANLAVLAAAVAVAGSGHAATSEREQDVGARSPASPNGELLYRKVGCAQCHGGVGQGGSAGPALAGKRLPYPYYDTQVRKPVDTMPPYTRKVLSDAELRAIYDYVMTFEP